MKKNNRYLKQASYRGIVFVFHYPFKQMTLDVKNIFSHFCDYSE